MKEIHASEYEKLFSICTLVSNLSEYQKMVESFQSAGFISDYDEYLFIDNSRGNCEDGFSGINKFLNRALGKFILICHQDVVLKFDDRKTLLRRIEEMDALDPQWAILGNAGYAGFTEKYYRISDLWEEDTREGDLPAKVRSLDENFLLIKNEANLALSRDLSGFHLYGTELCRIAAMLGWNAYVIDFHLLHNSRGKCDARFFESKKAFVRKYAKLRSSFALRTTCTSLFVTPFGGVNALINDVWFERLFENVVRLIGLLQRGFATRPPISYK